MKSKKVRNQMINICIIYKITQRPPVILYDVYISNLMRKRGDGNNYEISNSTKNILDFEWSEESIGLTMSFIYFVLRE